MLNLHPLVRLVALTLLVLTLVNLFDYSILPGYNWFGDQPVSDIDIVLSYYREDVTDVSEGILNLRETLAQNGFSSRVIVYVKDESIPQNHTLATLLGADLVIPLPNLGREGGTFLTHILSEYTQSQEFPYEFSRHILFGQSILEYEDLVTSRISTLRRDTAFLSLGRYAKCDCGRDAHGSRKYFPRMREIYAMFSGGLCPSGGQLCTYKGQFIVSRKTILKNPKESYQHLLDVLQAPKTHWIYNDLEDRQWEYAGKKSSPSSPFFGHALERSWPTIFGCTNPEISDECSLANPNACQCSDS